MTIRSNDKYTELIAEGDSLRKRGDRLTDVWDWAPRMIVEQLNVPASLISVLYGNDALIMGSQGLPQALRHLGQMPMTYSLCKYVVYAQRAVRLTDLDQIDYLRDNRLVHEYGAMAYIGVPIVGRSAQILGALCAVDNKPRIWTDDELETLTILGTAISQQMQSLN